MRLYRAQSLQLSPTRWRRSVDPTLTNISSDNLISVESRVAATKPTEWLRGIARCRCRRAAACAGRARQAALSVDVVPVWRRARENYRPIS